MGRKPQTTLEKALAGLQKLGITPPSDVKTSAGSAAEQSRTAEAIVEYVRRPDKFRYKSCVVCKEPFLVNYPSVAMCEDKCRIEHLRRIGIEWDPNKSAEARWSPADVPLVIPAPALRGLLLALLSEQSGVALLQSCLPKHLSLDIGSQSPDSLSGQGTLDRNCAMQA